MGRPALGERRAARHSGSALLVVLTLLVALAAVSFGMRLRGVAYPAWRRDADTGARLGEARSALIDWSATAVAAAGGGTPGLLPFPDRNRDGNYDGKGDCVTFGLNTAHLLGRLPWAGDDRPCPRIGLHVDIRDANGEPLWYAVSRNLVARGGGGAVNPDMVRPGAMAHPWIVVRDPRGNVVTDPGTGRALPVAAVVAAPGGPLGDQDRSQPAPPPQAFLDRIAIGATTFDNADADGCADAFRPPCGGAASGEEFVLGPAGPASTGFNDRLVYIAAGDIVRAVEKRVLGEVAAALGAYHAAYGVYPWLARFRDPRATDFKSTLARRGLLAVHLPGERFSTRFEGRWRFIDATPTTSTWHSGDAALVPPLADVLDGAIRVTRASGRCEWREWRRADCTGTRRISAYYRRDLGRTVTRVVEYAFGITDAAPRVIAPNSRDVRRRTLVENPLASGTPPSPGWSVRVTDGDGHNSAWRSIAIDADTDGAVTLSGIRYDLSVVYDGRDDERDELPEWLVENGWHRFIEVAYSADAAPGGDRDGDGDCATPMNTCLALVVDGNVVRADVRALVVSSGVPGPLQDRGIGDCDGDGVYDNFLCAYFESGNADVSTPAAADTFAQDAYGARFNDQVRVVAPLPR